MRSYSLMIFSPGEHLGVLDKTGELKVYRVTESGELDLTTAGMAPVLEPTAAEQQDSQVPLLKDGDSVDVLPLSVRSYNVLKREGIDTVGKLLAAEERIKTFELRNLGERGVTEILNLVDRIKLGRE